jgi:hypothetical protein
MSPPGRGADIIAKPSSSTIYRARARNSCLSGLSNITDILDDLLCPNECWPFSDLLNSWHGQIILPATGRILLKANKTTVALATNCAQWKPGLNALQKRPDISVPGQALE